MSDQNNRQQHLIIFTRYPEPGKAKTRLIPAIGAQAAAQLQRQMTEYTLAQALQLQNQGFLTIEVRFTDGSLALMQNWLGTQVAYHAQGGGDLGARIANSLTVAFTNGNQRIAVIGTDCPELTAELIKSAFEQLNDCDVVLGPAVDGGYYLIALKQLHTLFSGIDWGSSQVLQQTVTIAQKLNLSIAYLPRLVDIDRPDDLSIWEKIQTQQQNAKER